MRKEYIVPACSALLSRNIPHSSCFLVIPVKLPYHYPAIWDLYFNAAKLF